jgi:Uma2 family endonuclease
MTLRAQHTQSAPTTEPEAETDPFYYGHRFVITHDENGEELFTQQPLSLEDFLDPQEGDHFLQGTLHYKDVGKVASIFRHLHRNEPTTAVFSDLKMVWDIEGLSQPAPDVAVVPNVTDAEAPRGNFDVAVEGTRPQFVLEMVSPRYREADREKKVPTYETAGVKEYIIIDSWLVGKTVSYEVLGYRLTEGRFYTEIPPDERGWIYSETNRVWIGVNEERDGFFVVDAETEEEILPDEVAREEAERQAQAEAEARQTAERQVQAEAEARQTAERQARTEVQARQTAERQARTEAQARQTAERQARTEAQARQTAERQAEAERRQAQAEAEARQTAERQAQAETEARQTAERQVEAERQQTRVEAEARQAAEQRAQSLEAELERLREEFARARQPER